MTRFRPAIDALRAYAPGEQPPDGVDVVKLNTNENPYPPSPRALAALGAIDAESLRRYPQPLADTFRRSAAEVLGVDPEWILVGNGSDDLLTMLFRAVTGAGRAVAYPAPTYVLYRTLAAIQGAPVLEAPFDEEYTLPVDALADSGAALTIVANPNSPSGTAATTEQLAELADRAAGVVAVDEAYVAFADGSALDLVRGNDRVIVLRTLSKSHGLAGLRLGFGIAHPDLLSGLAKVKDSYNVDAVAAAVGAAAVRDVAYTRETVERIRRTRARLGRALADRGFRIWPSQANFVLARPADGDARRLYHGLRERGVLVRYFAEPGLADKLRITIGTEQETTRLLSALADLTP
ncbi:MAG: histidinol-phosphate transaminase [Acidobacteria bacterium]|nr:histidinol-phosphate transaminase [Acidobacteriota bacterium]